MKRLILFFSLCVMITSCCSDNGAKKADDKALASRAVLENIASRKSVRSYTSEPVPDDMVETLLRAAMAAPSAKNIQPWEFVVVRDRAVLDTLASRLKYAKMLSKASLAIVVCGRTVSYAADGTLRENHLWVHDACAATENLLLAAESLGLGAVWTAAYADERAETVREVLSLPSEVESLCVVPVGFPAGEEQPKDKWDSSKIHYEKW